MPSTLLIYFVISLTIHTLFFLGMFSCWVRVPYSFFLSWVSDFCIWAKNILPPEPREGCRAGIEPGSSPAHLPLNHAAHAKRKAHLFEASSCILCTVSDRLTLSSISRLSWRILTRPTTTTPRSATLTPGTSWSSSGRMFIFRYGFVLVFHCGILQISKDSSHGHGTYLPLRW